MEKRKIEHSHVATNNHNEKYLKGVGNPAKWLMISDKLKEKDHKKTTREIAEECHVSVSTVSKVSKRNRDGEYLPRNPGPPPQKTKLNDQEKGLIRSLVDLGTFQTCHEINLALRDCAPGLPSVCDETVRKYLHELHFSKRQRNQIHIH
jgi:transposase